MMTNEVATTINVTGDIFIIPNRASRLSECFKGYQEMYKEICKYNNKEFDPNMFIIETWMVAPELSDNLGDEGFIFEHEGKEFYVNPGRIKSFVPECFLSDVKEGDYIEFTYKNVKATEISKEKNEIKISINFKFRANQRDYRYRNFGNFEDVLTRVTR